MAQFDLSVKDRRGAIGASSSKSRLGDSHSETPDSVIKEPAITLSNPKIYIMPLICIKHDINCISVSS